MRWTIPSSELVPGLLIPGCILLSIGLLAVIIGMMNRDRMPELRVTLLQSTSENNRMGGDFTLH